MNRILGIGLCVAAVCAFLELRLLYGLVDALSRRVDQVQARVDAHDDARRPSLRPTQPPSVDLYVDEQENYLE